MIESIGSTAQSAFQRLMEPSAWDDTTVSACQEVALQEIVLCGASYLLASNFRKSDRDFHHVEKPEFLYLIPALLTGIIEKTLVEDGFAKLVCSYLRAGFGSSYLPIFIVLIHEMGHVLMHTLLYKDRGRIAFLSNTNGGASIVPKYEPPSQIGEYLSVKKRDFLVTLGGPLVETALVIGGIATARFSQTIDPQILRKIIVMLVMSNVNSASYAYSAAFEGLYNQNDYAQISHFTGISCKLMAAFWVCLTLVSVCLLEIDVLNSLDHY